MLYQTLTLWANFHMQTFKDTTTLHIKSKLCTFLPSKHVCFVTLQHLYSPVNRKKNLFSLKRPAKNDLFMWLKLIVNTQLGRLTIFLICLSNRHINWDFIFLPWTAFSSLSYSWYLMIPHLYFLVSLYLFISNYFVLSFYNVGVFAVYPI